MRIDKPGVPGGPVVAARPEDQSQIGPTVARLQAVEVKKRPSGVRE